MLNWQEVPFVRLLLPFLAGLLCGAQAYFSTFQVSSLLSMLLIGGLGLLAISYRPLPYRWRWTSGLLLFSISFLLGISLWRLQTPLEQARHYVHQPEQEQFYVFRIDAIRPSSSGKTNRLEIAIMGFGKQPEHINQISGQSFCYLPASFPFSVGDYYLAKGKLQDLKPTVHPVSFDFSKFMQQQGRIRQLYLPDQEVYKCSILSAPNFQTILIRWSNALQKRLQSLLPESSAGLISALVLGQKNNLNPEIKADYAKVGAMHVLAVSGMHVGIVAMGLQFILAFWRKPGWGPKVIKTVISLVAIWLFALLAGSSPSVMRAATMFSLFTMGRELHLQKNAWNIIAATALLMLCLDTRAIFSVGFQLSYAAVASIIYFQPRLYKLLKIKAKGLDYFWQLLSLGLAAQLGTAAISIHYFHQFPVYFWLSGLVIVPLATLALLFGIAVLILGKIPLLGLILSKGLHYLVNFMNKAMAWIGQLPGSQIEGLYLSSTITLLCLALILLSVLYYHFREKILAYSLIASVSLMAFQYYFEYKQVLEQQSLLIYECKGGFGMSAIKGRRAQTYLSDTTLRKSIAYPKNNFFTQKRIRESTEYLLGSQNCLIEWEGVSILYLSQHYNFCYQEQTFDLLVLALPFREYAPETIKNIAPKQVLFHHSLSYRDRKKWEKALGKSPDTVVNHSHSNAYYIPLK